MAKQKIPEVVKQTTDNHVNIGGGLSNSSLVIKINKKIQTVKNKIENETKI